MRTNEIIAQIIGIALIVTTLLTPHPKTRSGMLMAILVANILSCAMFHFVDAKSGLFGLIVTTVRSIVYWGYSYKDKKSPLFVLVFFLITQIIATFVGWENWASAITLVLVLNTYGQWQTNKKVLRICLALSAFFMGFYCLYTNAYAGGINKFLQVVSTLVAMHKTDALQNAVQMNAKENSY